MSFTPRSGSMLFVRALSCGFVLIGLSGLLAQQSHAGTFTLVDENSSATFDTGSSNNASSWVVDGVNQLFQQAFWYRVGNVAEQSVHSLPIGIEGMSDTNFDGDPETLFVRYDGAGFRITVTYGLDGGLPGSRASDMAEQISISNTGTSALDFHFFQYVDFDLNGTSGNDSAFFADPHAVVQSEGAASISETVITPVPSHREINTFPNIVNSLTDGVATTLSDLPPIGLTVGPGDMTWAFQWDFTLPRGATFQISKDKQLTGIPGPGIPEPTAFVLMALAGLMLGLRRGQF